MSSSLPKSFISLSDLYVAYKKAKVEAYYENTHFHALAFTEYEQDLHRNLSILHAVLLDKNSKWSSNLSFIGDYAYLPRSIDCTEWDNDFDGHFRALNPLTDWERRFEEYKTQAITKFRLIIRPSVDFQVISALWIIKVGHLFDGAVNSDISYANRLRRSYGEFGDVHSPKPELNLTAMGLFIPYFSSYRKWRENGLAMMEKSLLARKNILAITMDIEQFYHRVSPKFMLRESFLSSLDLVLSQTERKFTSAILEAIQTWYRSTPDFEDHTAGAIPVGLSASKIIANVLLANFDNAIVNQLHPIYYGRYVDDVFLVIENIENLTNAKEALKSIADSLKPFLIVQQKGSGAPSLKLDLPYARDSHLVFSGEKQKIFALSSEHGLDLIQHIREQIRIQSSEYRLLPVLPTAGVEMASKALLATPNATLQVDALRKADVVSVRRLGISLLLRDIESYSADLQPKSWLKLREEFYGLVKRHVLTPTGFFEYFGYLPRVFGLMLSCRDVDAAKQFVSDLIQVVSLLKRTTTVSKPEQQHKFDLCLAQYGRALLQAGLSSATERKISIDKKYLSIIKELEFFDPNLPIPSSVTKLKQLVHQILLADWGRRPYKDYWYLSQETNEAGPPIPRQREVIRKLRLGAIRRFRKQSTDLKVPHWPALVFPTRPLRVDEIALIAPDILKSSEQYKHAIMALRGARVPSLSKFGVLSSDDIDNEDFVNFVVPGKQRKVITVAITSYQTTKEQWIKAAKNKQDRSLERYKNLNWLVNRILQETNRPDYIIFPELSIPLRWALRVARKLATNNVSLLAGVEYHLDRSTRSLRNDCLISLVTNWPGYACHIARLQPKFSPAHGELIELRKLKQATFLPKGYLAKPTVYVHKGFCFSTLICSDLTNLTHRHYLRGNIDALFALEWNLDTKTFASLVEATASDLHAFVAQVNNRLYGDSRIRVPAKEDFLRDLVQVKGGTSDYYVFGEIDYLALRKEQRRTPKIPRYKPIPIGFLMSSFRKKSK